MAPLLFSDGSKEREAHNIITTYLNAVCSHLAALDIEAFFFSVFVMATIDNSPRNERTCMGTTGIYKMGGVDTTGRDRTPYCYNNELLSKYMRLIQGNILGSSLKHVLFVDKALKVLTKLIKMLHSEYQSLFEIRVKTLLFVRSHDKGDCQYFFPFHLQIDSMKKSPFRF